MISAAIERCAGIDVGKKSLAVCVMVGPLEGEPRVEIRKFGTIRAELDGLRDWLKQQGVTHYSWSFRRSSITTISGGQLYRTGRREAPTPALV